MNEHAPITDYDATGLTDFFTRNSLQRSVRQASTSGKQITALQTYGTVALEARWAKESASRQLGRELQNADRFRTELLGLHLTGEQDSVRAARMAEVEHMAGRSRAAQPWDLLAETARPTAELRGSGEPSFEPDLSGVHRGATVWLRLKRMAQQGNGPHTSVLELVFGRVGQEYYDSGLPRQAALLFVVPAGRDLLGVLPPLPAMAGPRSDWDALREHARRRAVQHGDYAQHEELFALADEQWRRLYLTAARAWCAARGGA